MAQNVAVGRSFGTPYERNGALVIPVAFVMGGGGFGEGPTKPPETGRTRKAIEVTKGEPADAAPPTGTGGGFGGLVFPLGAYVVKDDQVRWVPAYATSLMILAGLGVLRALLGAVRLRRRRRT
jgi:uncharacterized spore protein YtfJ